MERIFVPKQIETPGIRPFFDEPSMRGASVATRMSTPGTVVRSRRTENPVEIDLRATLNHTLLEAGDIRPRLSDPA